MLRTLGRQRVMAVQIGLSLVLGACVLETPSPAATPQAPAPTLGPEPTLAATPAS